MEVEPGSEHSQVLDYRTTGTPMPPRRRLFIARRTVLASTFPVAIFVALLFAPNRWTRWLNLGHKREQYFGALWMAIATFSLVCVIAMSLSRKRWDVWLVLLIHIGMLGFTIFPGCFAIRWLMHWGPPGPGS